MVVERQTADIGQKHTYNAIKNGIYSEVSQNDRRAQILLHQVSSTHRVRIDQMHKASRKLGKPLDRQLEQERLKIINYLISLKTREIDNLMWQ